MSVVPEQVEERREFRNALQGTVDEQDSFAAVPLALARAIRGAEVSSETKLASLGFVRSWADYAAERRVSAVDPFAVRYHVTQFAAAELDGQATYEDLHEVDVAVLKSGGRSYADILSSHVSQDILHDPHVAIVGGAARVALKMYAGVDIGPELPINDIDAVITSKTGDVAAKANGYGIDLSGAKVVDGDVRLALNSIGTNVDCSMNQAAVYGGRLLFTKQALADVTAGNIRPLAKNDLLFGPKGLPLPDGNVYINRGGFYRGLAFLLRGKGDQLIVSQENIELEKDSIGRYWQVMLYVKLLSMQDEAARYRAIGQWHELAQRMGSTETPDAVAFLDELTEQFPNTNAGKRRGGEYNAEGQARWIIGRLVGEVVRNLYKQPEFVPPATYTEANLKLSDDFAPYDYAAFMRVAKTLR